MHPDPPAYQGCVRTDISARASKHTSVSLTLEKSKNWGSGCVAETQHLTIEVVERKGLVRD